MSIDIMLLAILSILIIPIIIELIIRPLYYRLNDLTTNLSLGMINTIAGIMVGGPTLLIYVYFYNQYSIIHLSPKNPTTWFLAFFVLDFLAYWVHRTYHHMSILWTLHAVHHSGEDMNFGLAFRESVFGNFIVWVFFLPLAIIGVPLEVYLPLFVTQVIYQYFQHNTYISELGWLEYILVTPSQHRVHHGKNKPYINKNFGIILVIWDRMFGTYQKELPECPVIYGISDSAKTWNPLTINLHHIRKLFSKVRSYHNIGDKLRVLAFAPDWVPSHQRKASKPENSAVALNKYDSSISHSALCYGASQFLIAFLIFLLFVLMSEDLNILSTTILIGFISFTIIVVGGIFDAKHWVLLAEITRITVLATLALVLLISEIIQFDLSFQIFTIYCLVSMFYLARTHCSLRNIKQ